ncbi:MAG: DUF3592 domain-containing protein [Chloroflexota bacterium]
MSAFGVVLTALVVAAILPAYFAIPGMALIAVVGITEVRPIFVERRLARTGQVVAGAVTALEPMKKIRKHPLEAKWIVAYRYVVAGTSHRGRSRALPYGVIEGIGVGDVLAITVDPDHPQASVWIAG